MMRRLFLAALLAISFPALAADVGVSVSVGQPGFYGRLDLGNAAPPPVVYEQPVVVQPAPVEVAPPPPVYLHVRPGEAEHWGEYCHAYNACGVPVYFVHDGWYNDVYVQQYRHGHHHDDDEDDDDDHDEHWHDHKHHHHDEDD